MIWLPKPARNGFVPRRLCMMKYACFASRRRLPCTCLGRLEKFWSLITRGGLSTRSSTPRCTTAAVQALQNGCDQRRRTLDDGHVETLSDITWDEFLEWFLEMRAKNSNVNNNSGAAASGGSSGHQRIDTVAQSALVPLKSEILK